MKTTVTTAPFANIVAVDDINARAASKDGIAELADSIARRGLIQPLAVRPQKGSLPGNGGPREGDRPNGFYEIIDGRRRYLAIKHLMKTGALPKKGYEVPVIVRDEDDAEALETSLVANTARLPMHAVDQYEVFTRLAAQGRADAEIAARFGISERTVRQQRALGALAPSVRKAWREGKIDAKAAQAFCCNSDHAAQEAAWAKLKGSAKYGLNDYQVRSELAGEREKVSRVAAPVLARYVAAGGTTSEDLFEDHAWIDDAALLARCEVEERAEMLAPVRARLAGHGWAWIADADELPGGWRYQWPRLKGGALTEDEERRHDELLDRIADAAEGSDEQRHLIAEADAIIEGAALRDFTPEMRARAGVVIEVDRYGRYGDEAVDLVFGVMRPGDQGDIEDAIDARAGAASQAADDESFEPCPDCAGVDSDDCDTCDGSGVVPADHGCDCDDDGGACSPCTPRGDQRDDDTPSGPFDVSGALRQTVSEALTVAVAGALAEDASLAMKLLTAALECRHDAPAAVRGDGHACVRQRGTQVFADVFAGLLGGTEAAARQRFAAAVATTLDLTHDTWRFKSRDSGTVMLRDACPPVSYLAAARTAFLADDYFKRASKETAIAALDEMREAGCAAGLAPGDVLAGMKKSELAGVASSTARACGWLPPELRHPAYDLATGAAIAVPTGEATARRESQAPNQKDEAA